MESCNREWALYPTWGIPQASPSALSPRILRAVPFILHKDGQLKREKELCLKRACLKISADVTWQLHFILNWCPQCHQIEHRNKQKSQRSIGLSKFVIFPSFSPIKKKVSSYRGVRERQQMKNTIFLISSPHLRLTDVQMQLSDSKLTFLCKQKKGFFPTQHRHHVLTVEQQ